MNDTPLLLKELGRRAVPSGLCFSIGTFVLLFGSRESLGIDPLKVMTLIVGVGFLVAGSIILAPTLARIIAQPSGNIFYPLERFSAPQPVYSIPRARRIEGKFDEALDGFRTIIDEHPQELSAYLEIIDLAHRDLKDDSLAEAVFLQGMNSLSDEQARRRLRHKYEDAIQPPSSSVFG